MVCARVPFIFAIAHLDGRLFVDELKPIVQLRALEVPLQKGGLRQSRSCLWHNVKLKHLALDAVRPKRERVENVDLGVDDIESDISVRHWLPALRTASNTVCREEKGGESCWETRQCHSKVRTCASCPTGAPNQPLGTQTLKLEPRASKVHLHGSIVQRTAGKHAQGAGCRARWRKDCTIRIMRHGRCRAQLCRPSMEAFLSQQRHLVVQLDCGNETMGMVPVYA